MSDERISAMRAMAHPVRLRMLSLLTGTAMSAAEVARELDLTHANASYHLRLLAEAGELVVDGEERVRGGLAKRYRYPHEQEGHHAAAPDPGRAIDPEDRLLHLRATTTELERRLTTAAPGGWASDLEGWVDPGAWERARELVREASRVLHDANRAPRTAGTVHVSFTAMTFDLPATPSPEEDHR